MGFEFSKDTENQEKYFITTLWQKLNLMQNFCISESGFMMTGAFKALGILEENKHGLMIEIN